LTVAPGANVGLQDGALIQINPSCSIALSAGNSAGCASDIMVSNVQFSLKVLEPNKISRMFPGMPEMEISYYRCQI
jgi:hypothetical protein